MSMNKIVVTAALAASLMVVGFNTALADDASNSAPPAKVEHEGIDADKASKHMQKQLGLTDEQTSDVKAIMEDMHKEGEKIRQEMMELKAKTDEKFKKVLNKEQYDKWTEMRDKRHKR